MRCSFLAFYLLPLALFTALPVQAEAPAQKAAPAPVTAPVRPVPPSFADIVQTLSPAVVNISTTQKVQRQVGRGGLTLPDDPQFDPFRGMFEPFGEEGARGPRSRTVEQEVFSLGSGFIIDAGGYVVTNNHVVGEAESIKVILSDNTKLDAKLVGKDAKTDLALLKVESKKPLAFVKFADSDKARTGDWVLAIGNPFGLGGTVTSGIISARARNIHSGPFDDYIQTDAAINRGNSGGPLFNLNGEVIGINSAIFSPTGGNIGIGFAVPANLARPVIEQLKTTGRIERGWLGVKIQDVTDEVANSLGLSNEAGVLVLEVTAGGPAEKAGVKSGDVITAFDGKEVTEQRSLPRLVAEAPIGKKALLTVWRAGKAQALPVTIGKLKDEEADAAKKPGTQKHTEKASAFTFVGMGVAELTADLRAQFGIAEGVSGVIVVELSAEGEAAGRGVRYGDVIIQVNGTNITGTAGFVSAIKQAKATARKFVLLRLARQGDEGFVTLPIE